MKVFTGRINRATYWAMVGLAAALYAIVSALLKTDLRIQEVVLAFVCVPRLHDIGKSGWVFLIGIAVEILGIIVTFTLVPEDLFLTGLGITTLIVGFLIIWLGSIPGDANDNRFGASPASGITFR